MGDLSERIKIFLKLGQEQEHEQDKETFAERAEWFFEKRPQLLSLLDELYSRYMTLLNRCNQRNSSYISTNSDSDDCWDAESSLSYQQTPSPTNRTAGCNAALGEELVAQLITQNVEADLMKNQLSEMENQCHESSRKIDLLKKLLEVLESERILLLNENARLEYKVAGLHEENQGLASEAIFLKKKAAQLARCVLQMREDHRVFLLNRKIEDLQAQIYGLEKRNKEYYEQLLMKENPVIQDKSPLPSRNSSIKNLGLMGCFQTERIKKKSDFGFKRIPDWIEKVRKSLATSTAPSPFSSCSSYSA